MLQLHPAPNLFNAQTFQPHLIMPKCLSLVHSLRVLAPVKNCGAFLPRTPGEGIYGHFCTVVHTPPTDPLRCRAAQAAHVTEGVRAETGEDERREYVKE